MSSPQHITPGSLWRESRGRRLLLVSDVDGRDVYGYITDRYGRRWRKLRHPVDLARFACAQTDPLDALIGGLYVPVTTPPPGAAPLPGLPGR